MNMFEVLLEQTGNGKNVIVVIWHRVHCGNGKEIMKNLQTGT